MAKILVTGASGLLGVNFCSFARESHQVLGVVRKNGFEPSYPIIKADLFDRYEVEKAFEEFQPDAILHTAAMADVEACERQPEIAELVNTFLPSSLAELAQKNSIKFIHISTDAMFYDVSDKVFKEDDPVNPNSVYAQTKYKGELAIQKSNPDALIARVNFFGWSVSGSRSLAEFFFNQLSNQKKCFGFRDVFFCPLFVDDLSSLLLKAFENDLSGVYHFTGDSCLSKYDFGIMIAEKFGLDKAMISPTSVELSTLGVKRSHNLRLSNSKLSTSLSIDIPDVSTGIQGFYSQYQQGYPQKIRSYQQDQKRS